MAFLLLWPCFAAAGVMWGSKQIILTVSPLAGFKVRRTLIKLVALSKDTLNDIIDMLEEISSSLPKFTTYEKTIPINSTF